MTVVIAAAVALALYVVGFMWYARRFPHRPFPLWRPAAFGLGIICIVLALCAPAQTLAERSFAAHMMQHIALMLVAPPLLLLGAPLLLIVAAPSPRLARRITHAVHSPPAQAFFSPVGGWLFFVAALWAAHFSPLYELSLEHPAIHVMEHVLFAGAALLFWAAIVQVGYAPRAVPFPARMLLLFLAIPQGAFLGLALYTARGVLYPHYLVAQGAGAAAADQRSGGEIMWILGGFLLFVAFMITGGAWAASERRHRPLLPQVPDRQPATGDL